MINRFVHMQYIIQFSYKTRHTVEKTPSVISATNGYTLDCFVQRYRFSIDPHIKIKFNSGKKHMTEKLLFIHDNVSSFLPNFIYKFIYSIQTYFSEQNIIHTEYALRYFKPSLYHSVMLSNYFMYPVNDHRIYTHHEICRNLIKVKNEKQS